LGQASGDAAGSTLVHTKSGSISSREVNAALRSLVWPVLREWGFSERTQRTAWSYREGCIAVVNFQSFNSYLAEGLGATTFSFAVNLGVHVLCSTKWLDYQVKVKDGKLRPVEWACDVRRHLEKTISQEELERRDVWYVRPDGSNVTETVDDARSVLLTTGVAWLDEFSDLERILAFVENEPEEWDAREQRFGTWGPGRLGSPNRLRLADDLRRARQT